MLKKILATYLSMVIIYQEQNIINMLNIFMHQTIIIIIIIIIIMKEEKKEEKKRIPLAWACSSNEWIFYKSKKFVYLFEV